MGNRSRDEEQQYKRNNPLRGAQDSLINIRNSFATRQRRLLNQLQQQIAAKDSRGGAASEIPQDRTSVATESTSRATTRAIPRGESYQSTKSNYSPQTIRSKSLLRKEPPNFDRRSGKTQQPAQDGAITDSDDDLKLNPPAPKGSVSTVEGLSVLLFSEDHLQFTIREPHLYGRFAQFLAQYEPHLLPILLHHMDIQKATKALEYANAVASTLGPFPYESESQKIETAAVMNESLHERRQRVVDILISDALPAQINCGLIDVVTNAMEKAIRGTGQTTLMRDLIGGLSEVFTLTDPSIEDNPIIYASDEFYNMTGYGRDYVIGRNCRFLQGPFTRRHSIRRLKTNIDNGIEISETLLNYRRDGTPFMNLLLVAPLHDSKMNIKYYIGAQVDVTGLVEEGQGLEGFVQFLRAKKRGEKLKNNEDQTQNLALQKLAELSAMFDVSENMIVRSNPNSGAKDSVYGSITQNSKPTNRRIVLEESQSEDDEDVKSQITEIMDDNWKLAAPGVATGILPGVYQKYLLLKPTSLKVIFISSGLRNLSQLLKRGFMDCIESTKTTMKGLRKAFETGSPVSAKISWKYPVSTNLMNGETTEKGKSRRDTWISATPMLGSDESVGVWMIVVVQNSPERIQSNPTTPQVDLRQDLELQENESMHQKESMESAPHESTTAKKHQKRNSVPLAHFVPDPLQTHKTQTRPKSSSIACIFDAPKSSISKVFSTSSSKKKNGDLDRSEQLIPTTLTQANIYTTATSTASIEGGERTSSQAQTEDSFKLAPDASAPLQESNTTGATRTESSGAMGEETNGLLMMEKDRLEDEQEAGRNGKGKGMAVTKTEAEVDRKMSRVKEMETRGHRSDEGVGESEVKSKIGNEGGASADTNIIDEVDVEDADQELLDSDRSHTPTPRAREKENAKGKDEIFETWSPPCKQLLAKSAEAQSTRPPALSRTMSID